jgi:hypothetical protein
MYNLRGWRIPKGQSKCTISEVGECRRAIKMYNPEVGEYRRGNQNVQSQRLENTEGAIKMYNPEVREYRRGNQNVQSRGWRIPKGQSECTISEA